MRRTIYLSRTFGGSLFAECRFILTFAFCMNDVIITSESYRSARQKGMDAVLELFVGAINDAIGSRLTAETMALINADQTTLLAYNILRDEVMDGGFVQLIHNGYGAFIFLNPFARAVRGWGLADLAALVNKGHKLYDAYHKEIEVECSDDEFMAMFERFEKFDDLDDSFIENEEQWTAAVARYIVDNVSRFAVIKE